MIASPLYAFVLVRALAQGRGLTSVPAQNRAAIQAAALQGPIGLALGAVSIDRALDKVRAPRIAARPDGDQTTALAPPARSPDLKEMHRIVDRVASAAEDADAAAKGAKAAADNAVRAALDAKSAADQVTAAAKRITNQS